MSLTLTFAATLALVFYTFTAFGFCWGIGASKLTLPLRNLLAYLAAPATRRKSVRVVASFVLALVECPACFGFWVGLVAGWRVTIFIGAPLYWALALAFYTAGVNYLLGRASGLISEP